MHIFSLLLIALFLSLTPPAQAQEDTGLEIAPVHAIAMHGEAKYKPYFTHFDYVNPEAPKGGTLKLRELETFDNLNAYIIKGVAAGGLGMIYETLLTQSADEPFTAYGAIAETLVFPPDRSWVIFNMRPEARWHDGVPITAADVVWSFNTLMKHGTPFYKAYYVNVETVEAVSEYSVQFTFDMAGNRELPIIVGQMPVLPQHYWESEGHDFTKTTLEPPLGSGPYKISTVIPGRSLSYDRVKNWWGENLPVFKGRYNFDRITYDYYRDQNVSLEAFFAGEYEFHREYTAKTWATGYDVAPVQDGRIIKKLTPNALPQGMQGFVYNIRRPVFQDRAVREAIGYGFDYEWSNKQFAFGAYKRSRSYFSNSEMEATGLPDERELAILEQYRGRIPDEIFTTEYNPPKTDGSGNIRKNLRAAIKLLDDAGYVMGEDGVRVHKDTGVRLEFEFLTNGGNAAFDRWILPFFKNLEKIGIKASFRVVDASQYVNRILAFDYDMTVSSYGQSNSPGNEQREYWGSDKADAPGSRNYIGIKDPVVDELVDLIVSAPTREDLVTRSRALDRVLQWGHYVIPNWHLAAWRIGYWNKFGQPEIQAPFALGVMDTWWEKE